jgi:hypothetical protein
MVLHEVVAMRFAQDLPLPALEVILRNCVVALAH